MDVITAREVMVEASCLVEQSAKFQALYGRYYQLKPGSPEDAWTRYQLILTRQSRIAQLLDSGSLEDTHRRCGEWWTREDVIDTGVLKELMTEIGHLLACCAYFEVETHGKNWSYAVQLSQRAIAGMLHPTSLQVASDERNHRYAS